MAGKFNGILQHNYPGFEAGRESYRKPIVWSKLEEFSSSIGPSRPCFSPQRRWKLPSVADEQHHGEDVLDFPFISSARNASSSPCYINSELLSLIESDGPGERAPDCYRQTRERFSYPTRILLDTATMTQPISEVPLTTPESFKSPTIHNDEISESGTRSRSSSARASTINDVSSISSWSPSVSENTGHDSTLKPIGEHWTSQEKTFDVRWQEFSPPKELTLLEENASREIADIVKESVVEQWQAARLAEDQRKSSLEGGPSTQRHRRASRSVSSPPRIDEHIAVEDGSGLEVDQSGSSSDDELEARTPPNDKDHSLKERSSESQIHLSSMRQAVETPSATRSSHQLSRSTSSAGGMAGMVGNAARKKHAQLISTVNGNGRPRSRSFLAMLREKKRKMESISECTVCKVASKNRYLIETDCGHQYCKTCYPEFAMNVVTKDQTFPPTCCNIPIKSKQLWGYLDVEQKKLFKQKEKEITSAFDARINAQPLERHRWQRCPDCQRSIKYSVGGEPSPCACKTQSCISCKKEIRACICNESSPEQLTSAPLHSIAEDSDDNPDVIRPTVGLGGTKETRFRIKDAANWERYASRMAQHRRKVEAKFRNLAMELDELHERQKREMETRHFEEAKGLQEEQDSSEAERMKSAYLTTPQMIALHQEKIDVLRKAHDQVLKDLQSAHQAEEDETFLSITRAYRGKPNQESRVKAMVDQILALQAAELERLSQAQAAEMERLSQVGQAEIAEAEGMLRSRIRSQRRQSSTQGRVQIQRFWADEEWFSVVVEARHHMLLTEQQRQIDDDSNIEHPTAEKRVAV